MGKVDMILQELSNYDINNYTKDIVIKPKVWFIPLLAFYQGKLSYKMGLKAAYEYGNITATQNIEFNTSEEQLYFEPLFISSTKLEYNKNLYRFGIDLQLLSGGVDDNDKDLANTFMMDISALYNLRDNISILAEARNLFNQRYKKYDNYIAEELQVIFGVKMTF